MGSGSYPTVIPKWKKVEQELIDRGLVPESLEKTEVKAFFKKTKADARAKHEKPYLMYPRVKLRQVVQAMQDEKRAASKKPVLSLSDYERTIIKKIKEDKKNRRRPGKMLHSLTNKRSNQCRH
jgi:hypothetical protein